jgi:hypothetical protein
MKTPRPHQTGRSLVTISTARCPSLAASAIDEWSLQGDRDTERDRHPSTGVLHRRSHVIAALDEGGEHLSADASIRGVRQESQHHERTSVGDPLPPGWPRTWCHELRQERNEEERCFRVQCEERLHDRRPGTGVVSMVDADGSCTVPPNVATFVEHLRLMFWMRSPQVVRGVQMLFNNGDQND